MPRDTPLYHLPTIIVTARDGTLFSCTAHSTDDASSSREIRWKLTDPMGVEHLGPPYIGTQSPIELQRLVAEWWDATKAIAQASADADGSAE